MKDRGGGTNATGTDSSLLIITSDFPPDSGGLSAYASGLAENLALHYPSVIVLVERRWQPAPKYGDVPPVSHFRLENGKRVGRPHISKTVEVPTHGSGFLRRVWKLFSAARWILRQHPDIRTVFAVTWSPAGVAAWLLSFFFSIRYFVAAHGLDILEPQRSRKYKALLRLTLGSAEKILPVSRFTRQELLKLGFNSSRTIVSPCGTNPRRFYGLEDSAAGLRRKYGLDDKSVLLTVGRLVRRKAHDLVIDVLKDLRRERPELVYLIAGEGPERANLESLTRRSGLEENVVFAGFVPDSELAAFYQASDVFVMPSRRLAQEGDVEGFGIVFLEANACGRPVIGSRSGGMEDAIIHEVTGLLIPPDDKQALMEAIARLLGSPELRRRLGEQGRERVQKELNWTVIAKNLVREMAGA